MIEAALLADGVKESEFYPVDLDRAFRKLDQIKPHIKTWWSDNSQAQQLMEQDEIDLIYMANGRASQSIIESKASFKIIWNQAITEDGRYQGWFVPVGCPNPQGGMKFLDIVGRAETQAVFARMIYYSPQNEKAYRPAASGYLKRTAAVAGQREDCTHHELRVVEQEFGRGAAAVRSLAAGIAFASNVRSRTFKAIATPICRHRRGVSARRLDRAASAPAFANGRV